MLSREVARSIVVAEISRYGFGEPGGVAILDEATIERPWGWVFFYQSRRYFEEGDFSACLAGNAPILIDARNGAMQHTGTAYPVEYYIDEYEREHGLA